MVFKGKGLRRWSLAMVSALALGACGGGDLVVPFEPSRYIAFGDEMSLLESDGRKYSVNAFNTATPPVRDCTVLPIWIQVVAAHYRMAFAQCPNGGLPTVAQTRAQVGMTVAQFTPLVDSLLANDAPKNQDLVTVMIGQHDVLGLYNESPRRPEAEMLALLRTRGAQLAADINRIAMAGPAVIVATIPDVGKSPLAIASGDGALLTRMVQAFNDSMRVSILQDGRYIGLVFGDAEIYNPVRFPGNYGYTNVVNAVCATALPDCTTNTLVTTPAGASATTWLWADATRPGGTFHSRLGQLTVQRAINNPF